MTAGVGLRANLQANDERAIEFVLRNLFKKEGSLPEGWHADYTSTGVNNGILTLTTNMDSLKDQFDLTTEAVAKPLCQPATMCAWKVDRKTNTCQCNISDKTNYLYDVCHEKNAAGNDAICSWSTKDLDCPAKGCPAFEITFPAGFKPDDAADHHRPEPGFFSFDKKFQTNWNISFNLENEEIAGSQCQYNPDTSPPTPATCLSKR
jgi:hypothetical protein